MPIANLTLTNTFDEWRTVTNQLVTFVNDLDSGNLTKFYSNSAPLSITENVTRGGKNFISLNVSSSVLDTSVLNVATANAVNIVFSTLGDTNAILNAAFTKTNTTTTIAISAYNQANTARDNANVAFAAVSSAFAIGNGAFGQANIARSHANAAFLAANTYAAEVGAAANGYATAVGTAGNNYTNTVLTAANNYLISIIAPIGSNANIYSRTVGTAGNNYTNTVLAAANNYLVSIIVPIGSNANNYAVAVGTAGNNYTNTVLAAANNYLVSIIAPIGSNANNYAVAVGTAGNNYTNTVLTAANNYLISIIAPIGSNANNYAVAVGAAGNSYARTVGTAGNNFMTTTATAVGAGANAYSVAVGTAGNAYARAVSTAANNYMLTIVAPIGSNANNYAIAVGAAGNSYARTVGTAGNNFMTTTATAVGAGANAYSVAVGTAGNNYTREVGTAGNNYIREVGTAGNTFTIFSYDQANNAYTRANLAYEFALSVSGGEVANVIVSNKGAYDQANLAFDKANAALPNVSTTFNGNLRFPTGNVTIGLATEQGIRLHVTHASNVSNVLPEARFISGLQFTHINSNTSNGAWNDLTLPRDHTIIYSNGSSDDSANLIIGPWTDSSFGYKQDGAGRHGFNTSNPRFTIDANGSANISGSLIVAGINVLDQITTVGVNAGAGANVYARSVGTGGNNYTNAVGTAGNNYTNTVGTAGNNYTNTVLAAANNYLISIIAPIGSNANNYATAVGAAGNSYARAVGAGANNYMLSIVAPIGSNANNYAVAVGTAGNAYAREVSTAANNYMLSIVAPIGSNANNYAVAVGAAGNSYARTVGAGANNYMLTIVAPIGSNANNYAVAVGAAGNSYAREVSTAANNYMLSIVAPIGSNANNYAIAVGAAGNSYARAVSTAANNYMLTIVAPIGSNANNYATAVGAAGNSYARAVGAGGNSYSETVGTAGNNYTRAVGTAGNNYTNSVGTAANNYMLTIVAPIGPNANNYARAVGTAANNYMLTTGAAIGAGANVYAREVATAANNYMLTTGAAIGAGANVYAREVGIGGNNYTTLVFNRANTINIKTDLAFIHANQAFEKANAALVNLPGLVLAGDLIMPQGNLSIGEDSAVGIRLRVNSWIGVANVLPQVEVMGGSQFIQFNANTNFGGWNDLVQERDITIIYGDFPSDVKANLVIAPWSDSSFGYKQDHEGRHGFNTSNPRFTIDANGSVNVSGSLIVAGTNIITKINNDIEGGNNYTRTVGTASNTFANTVGTAANNYMLTTGAAIGIGANTFANTVGTAANNYMLTTGAAIGIGANAFASSASNITAGVLPGARLFGAYTSVTGVGTLTTGTWNATTIGLAYGGTGSTTAAGARANLGLGTAATENIGTSGSVIGKLNGSNIWTGTQTFGNGTGYASAEIAGGAGNQRDLLFKSGTGAGGTRWSVNTNAIAEAGSNTGSNFTINRYSDTAVYIDTPFTINRQTGVTSIKELSLIAPLGTSLGGTGATDITTARNNLGAAGTGVVNYFTNSQVIRVTGANDALLLLDGPAGRNKGTWYKTGDVNRWIVYADSSSETGANNGTNFIFQSQDDTGNYKEQPLTISRATGITTLKQIVLTNDLAVAHGGTGASDAANARTSLGAAAIASPAFTGTPTAPSAAAYTNTTQIATTEQVYDTVTTVPLASYTAVSTTLQLSDAGKFLSLSNGNSMTVTVPPNSSVAFPNGTRIDLLQYNTGSVTIANAVGVTVYSSGNRRTLAGRYSGATLWKRTADEWILIGDLV